VSAWSTAIRLSVALLRSTGLLAKTCPSLPKRWQKVHQRPSPADVCAVEGGTVPTGPRSLLSDPAVKIIRVATTAVPAADLCSSALSTVSACPLQNNGLERTGQTDWPRRQRGLSACEIPIDNFLSIGISQAPREREARVDAQARRRRAGASAPRGDQRSRRLSGSVMVRASSRMVIERMLP
jgi:hypothetical protein